MERIKSKSFKKANKKSEDLSKIIELQKEMKLKCKALKVSYFDDTGRGIKCKKKIGEGDLLISLPLHYLITPNNATSDIFTAVNIHDEQPQLILSVFLIFEYHLGKESRYYLYLQTLPQNYSNLFFCTKTEFELLPEFLRKPVNKQEENLIKIFEELLASLKGKNCSHCKIPLISFFTREKFLWAWFTVNTRSVYYEEENKSEQSKKPLLALAPFLDLFNHSHDANTEMYIDFKNNFYNLKTLVPYKKYEQVFIKYGSHSNKRLLLEYGFILSNNPHDYVEFSFNEVLDAAKEVDINYGNLTKLKYKIVTKNKLNQDLTKNRQFSWSTKGLLYVLTTEETNLSLLMSKIYSNNFSETEKCVIEKIENVMSAKKQTELNEILVKMETVEKCTESFSLAKNLIKIYMTLL